MLLIKVHYGIKVQTTVLNSERDQNFLCNAGEKKYVLKISNPDEDRSVLEMQNACVQYIKEYDPSLQVPLAFKEVKTIENEGTSFFVRLVDYLPGQLLIDVVHHNDLLYELGSFLGRLRTAMNGFDHPAGHRDFPWDVAYIDFIKEHKHYLKSKEGVVDHFIDQYEQMVLPITSKLRKALIHNDGNDHNVLVNEYGETCGIIDFGDMVYTYIACEPAVCMAYVVLGKDEPLEPIVQVLKGFHERFPLTLLELSALIYMVCIRLCITVTMAAYRKQLFPDNKYISVTENQAFDFLEKMQNEDLNRWSDKLVEYAGS
ncbi:MAG TPA: phosphotransferase [Candidatus Marinimicrobia bacterium]|nr:phosphotransferase [Candidatus Neomarinimicrobiota bacterium]